ncbi:tetratricopeptide repeat protein [Mastigocladopsis repens]|uniref:tetratricopeptide repeat protein n=1 Tax=Mastigocladopsis repens TaxID=221287 RepID=UPI0004747183|nr:tetratricopeptide repeat protein [Mastigocladopsis repens]
MLRRLSVTMTATATFCLLCSSLTIAASKKPQPPDKFPPNPLEITTPDPLLPRSPKDKQPLTPQERQKLEAALDDLNQQAAAKLQAGDKITAFDIWNRELRLRRFLGSLAEVQALSRVGTVAWNQNESQQVQYITQRLQAIQKEAQSQKTTDLQLLQALGLAYLEVRSPKEAVEVYTQVLAAVRQRKDSAAEVDTLKTIGELHLGWFDYASAASTYEQLRAFASSRGERLNEIAYLQQLAYIYEQTKQPEQSLKIRNQLAEVYQQENNLIQLSTLKQAIGSDYESLARKNPSLLQEAFKNYQEAYTTAWQLEQYVRAGEALQKLIALYRSQGQVEEALQASQILLQAQERAANLYGLMNAYDQIGQIHLERKDYPQARVAFQKGLEIAQQLNYDELYFNEQIQKLSK